MQIKTFYFNPFRECTYLLSDNEGKTIVIDCGCYTNKEQLRLKEYISQNNLTITRHLLTHAHLDHTLGAKFIYENYGILPTLSMKDENLLLHTATQAAMFGIVLTEEPFTRFIPIENEKNFFEQPTMPTNSWSAFPTAGHTRGCVCYWFRDGNENILFTGDTLFANGIGRTDLPEGNYNDLMMSLQTLLTLPEQTKVFPGHGMQTTIEQEKRHNIYLKQA